MSFEDAIEKEIGRIPKSIRRKERGKIMVDISKHQLLKDISDLMQMIEEFPASDHQTATIIKAGEILDGIEALRAEIAALKEAVQLALTVGTAYPPESKARIDTHTQRVLESALKAKETDRGPDKG